MDQQTITSIFRARRLPVILQTEAAECGLACVAMVATYHGYEIDLPGLRRRFALSLAGARLSDIVNLASTLQLAGRALRLEVSELGKLKTPAILHWDFRHFVVLKRVSRKWVYVHNPALGARRYSHAEVSRHFTGVALELTPTFEFKPASERALLKIRSLWTTVSGLMRALAVAAVFTLALQAFALISPLYVQLAIDDAVAKHDTDLLTLLVLAFGALLIINTATKALRDYSLLYLGNSASYQLSLNLFRHMVRLPISFFNTRHIGDVVSRFGSLDPIRKTFTEGVLSAIADGLLALTTLALMFAYDAMLSAVVIASVLLYAILRLVSFVPLRDASQEEIVQGANQSTNLIETIRGIQSIKIFARENERQTVWSNKYARQINASARVSQLGIAFQTASALLSGLENILVIYLGAHIILSGHFTIGMLYAFISYKGQFSDRARSLVEGGIRFSMLRLYLDRVADIALAEPEFPISEMPVYREPITGALELQNCGFRYSDTTPFIFEHLSFAAAPGELIAIVGPSGCGKTTMMKVMMGLFLPQSGVVRIDGCELAAVGLQNYRAAIASVMQEDQLLSGTIAENIGFFEVSPDMARIEKCGRMAEIHDEITAMPMGYESLIGDMGTTLSGGQRQRVLIARAIYRDPKILFLDEGTAHLDSATEKKIVEMLSRLPMTKIVIAHRPLVVEKADRVFGLERGALRELTPTDLGFKGRSPGLSLASEEI